MGKFNYLNRLRDNFKATIGICAHRGIRLDVFKELWDLKKCPNPEIRVMPLDGDALISRSRSRLASYFLEKTDDEMLMFIDDDVKITPLDATKLLWLSHKEKLPICGAVYVTKSKERPGIAARPLNIHQDMRFGKTGGLYEMRNLSTGCMVIRREVLLDMVKHPEIHQVTHGVDNHYKYWSFFKQTDMLIDGRWEDISEDWFFCENARQMGHRIWADTTIKLGHIGDYSYDFDDLVNKRQVFDDIVVNGISAPSLNGSEAVKA